MTKMKSVSDSMDIDACMNLMVQIDEDDYDDIDFDMPAIARRHRRD